MRHIPEEELHAYLDQALSRSQCVEIERHLARCPRCRMERDSIAALRDRTTSILARVGPPPIVPPAFETLVTRAVVRRTERTRWIRRSAMAAGVGAVLVLGWWSTRLFEPEAYPSVAIGTTRAPADSPAAAPTVPVPTTPVAAPARHKATVQAAARTPGPARAAPVPDRQLVRASQPLGDEAPEANGIALAAEVDPPSAYAPAPAGPVTLRETATFELSDLVAQPVTDDPGLNGLWRTIEPDNASDRRDNIALVPGLPVLQMRVQPGSRGDDVTAVDQALESGELIRTISGPAPRVLALVNDDAAPDTTRLESRPGNMTVTIRQADRMVAVTGPANALGSLLSRVNVKAPKRRY